MPSILITGAGRGIGLALAQQYCEAGWQVIACHRSRSPALSALGERGVSLHSLDVVDDAQIGELTASLAGKPLDVLFNNAGVYGPDADAFGELDAAGLLATLHVNTVAPLLLAQALLPNLLAGSRKVIATLSSRMGSIADNGSGGHYPYRASKAGLNAALKSLAIDLGPRGFTVLVLHPGWVRTDMGGPHGQLSVDESAAGLRRLVDRASQRDNGKFLDVDGHELPW
ncbi:hypothetical protein BJI67_15500 [Acidihalobacter aeolianus]|uniref:Short-chain dehydrogenase n=1 Tax=Acidihalobacter aeolianus TaxID=2792603 RepID=A0A1D8KBE3_9GAMM|nr:SDR family oxidoreductase [Acidihalobacter aeolianus]AOV18280.1 hypothetical protein BJI67_15500 [Acidihalobacter aeolianus]